MVWMQAVMFISMLKFAIFSITDKAAHTVDYTPSLIAGENGNTL